MSEFLTIYDKMIEITYFVEVFFEDSQEPDCSVNPILGPEIIKKHLEDERKNSNSINSDSYVVPIKLMDAAGKSHATITAINFSDYEYSAIWKITFGFDFIEDVDEFMLQASRSLGEITPEVQASYSLNMSISDDDLLIQDAENLITENLFEASKKYNEIAMKESDKAKSNLFFLLDFALAEAADRKGELIDYIRVPSDYNFDARLSLVLLFKRFEQFRPYVEELQNEKNFKANAPLS